MVKQSPRGGQHEIETQVAAVTDESLTEARKLIGLWLRRHGKALTVTKDCIRQYAYQMGDDNPLFCNEEYAKQTRWGRIIAPPTILLLVDDTIIAPGLRGIQWVFSGMELEWFVPIRPDDRLTTKARMYDAIEHRGKRVPRMIEQIGEVFYYNQNNQLVARALGKTMRTPRAKAASGGMHYKPRMQKWSEEELKRLDNLYEEETKARRGGMPRYWEDVQIGEALPTLHKGPLRRSEIAIPGRIISGEGQTTASQGAHVYQVLHRRDHPADAYFDPQTGIQDHPHRGHWEAFMAREVGMPGVYDLGVQRIPWLAHLMTNWIGDAGFLKKLKGNLRRPNVVGDVTWLKGKVSNKYIENGEYLMECDIWGENQLGEKTMPGWALVSLPSKKGSKLRKRNAQ